MLTWEFSVLDFIQAHLRRGIGDTVMPFITRLGDGGAIWIVIYFLSSLFFGLTLAFILCIVKAERRQILGKPQNGPLPCWVWRWCAA